MLVGIKLRSQCLNIPADAGSRIAANSGICQMIDAAACSQTQASSICVKSKV